MTTLVCPGYAGYRFPVEVISHAMWLHFPFPLSLRMVEETPAARSITVSHESVWQLRASSARTLPTGSGAGCPVPEKMAPGRGRHRDRRHEALTVARFRA